MLRLDHNTGGVRRNMDSYRRRDIVTLQSAGGGFSLECSAELPSDRHLDGFSMEQPLYTRTEPVLLPYFPRLFYLALCEQGFSDQQIFAGLDLSAERLQDETYRLSIEQHELFILRMLELTGDPHFALQLIDRSDVTSPSLPMMAAANSGQIAKALHSVARYNKVLTRVFTVHMRDDPQAPRMDIAVHLEHESVTYFAVSAFVLFLNRFFREPLEGADLVERLELSVAQPAGFDAVRDQYPFDVSFSQPQSCVHLDSQYLERTMRQADPQTVRLLLDMAEQQLREAEAETTLVGAVKALLVDHLASPPKLDEAARVLGISPRGLRRKLAESGTTYQGVLDSVRLTMARRLIRETDAPISSIAYELGFAHASDFGRAFKKWTGLAPTAYRQTG